MNKNDSGSSVLFLLAFSCLILTSNVRAEEIRVAVAANFTAAIKTIRPGFETSTGHQLILSFASSGKLFAQISNGAPFDVMLSADKARPEKLEHSGLGIDGTRFTYALGKLVLWARPDTNVEVSLKRLKQGNFQYLAIANPKTAPYGKAAMEVIEALQLSAPLAEKLVQGDNIAQTMQFVYSGSAELGFVAFSQIKALEAKGKISGYWEVPENLYAPIEQQAILLSRGRENPAAHDFLEYLKRTQAQEIIVNLGYAISTDGDPL